MIVPDVNLLLYVYDSTSPYHKRAAQWWTACLNGLDPVGIPRVVTFGFVRLATNPRVFASPMSVSAVAERVNSWRSRSHVRELEPGPAHTRSVLDLLARAGTGGNLVTDAQIAAIALEYGATVFTNDADFQRFEGLKIANPLKG